MSDTAVKPKRDGAPPAGPDLTIIVVFYDMAREAPRTLFTLSPAFQRGVTAGDYEVIAIDNGSPRPLDPEMVRSFGVNFRHHRLERSGTSPGPAVNFGAARAETPNLAVIVDGARMVSPGLVAATRRALRGYGSAVVGAPPFHLGRDAETRWKKPYDQEVEDRLLDECDWRADGYELFRLAVQRKAVHLAFLSGLPNELSYFAMRRAAFTALGGFDERFGTPGGGFVNQDFLRRAVEARSFKFVMLLGEGTFHQFHGGVTTGAGGNQLMPVFAEEYQRIRGEPYQRFKEPKVAYFGTMPRQAWPFLHRPAEKASGKES